MNESLTTSYYRGDGDSFFDNVCSPLSRPRLRPLLDLAIKLNSAFLMAHDLDEILQAVLVGVTAGEGLGFNRAFLFQLNVEKDYVEGKLAIGPSSPEDARRIWEEISKKQLSLFEILNNIKETFYDDSLPLNKLVKQIKVPLSEKENILVKALNNKRAFWVGGDNGNGSIDLLRIFNTNEFAVAPLFAHNDAYGVIVADNFVTGRPIGDGDVDVLQLFAGFASLAVNKTWMCHLLEQKIETLNMLNYEIERNKDQLIEVERYSALGRMADQLLHEIRNPLSIIGGMSRTLEKKSKNPELRNYLDIIVRESERIEKILTAIFDFAKTPELKTEPVRLCDLIKTSLALLQSELNNSGIKSNTDFPDDDLVLYLDRIYIQQAFLSILKNAIEAMPEGGMLKVAVSKVKKSSIEIEISDTGLGMAQGYLNKAHEPFFTTKIHSIGLGLSLAKRTIELHGGFLCLNKNDFGGTDVIIRLPVVIP
jgi:signal transduction histidine kinase